MRKAIHGSEQEWLTARLRKARTDAGLRQTDVAERLGTPQSFVSKYEIGERRLDLVELAQVCDALGIELTELVKQFEKAARGGRQRSRSVTRKR